jgi:hypothetical protein
MEEKKQKSVYISKTGELFLKIEGFSYRDGIFKLQIISPAEHAIDPYWFETQIQAEEIRPIGGGDRNQGP